MSKHTYTVTAPDGSVHKRTTHRTYTHAVLVDVSADLPAGMHGWGVWGWAGRLGLAHKTAKTARKVWATVQVVPVDNPREEEEQR
jgi:hypothetical protein